MKTMSTHKRNRDEISVKGRSSFMGGVNIGEDSQAMFTLSPINLKTAFLSRK